MRPVFQIQEGMEITKLLSENVGSHYPVQAVIFTDKGEIYITKDVQTAEGYELFKLPINDLVLLTTQVNNALRGKTIASMALVELEQEAIHVSPVSNLFRVINYSENSVLKDIKGGRQAQQITVLGDGLNLVISASGNIRLEGSLTLTNEYSVLLLQKVDETWIEVARKQNNE